MRKIRDRASRFIGLIKILNVQSRSAVQAFFPEKHAVQHSALRLVYLTFLYYHIARAGLTEFVAA